MKNYKDIEKKERNGGIEDSKNWEERQNLLGFFSLLLKVDKRVNPHLYKNKKHENKNWKI